MNVLFPVDGSEASYRALRKGLQLLGGHPTLRAVALNVRPEGLQGAPEDAVRRFDGDEEEGGFPSEAASHRMLERAEAIANDVGVPLETKSGVGRPLETILAEARDYDVVAIHALSKSSVLDFLKGSGSGKLVRHAPASVLVVRD